MRLKQNRIVTSFFHGLLVTILVFGLTQIAFLEVFAQNPEVIAIIGSDTTWTKDDSPHIFSGQVLVNAGVTLTIESGATVDLSKEMRVNEGATLRIEPGATMILNGYGITVNGTIIARGTQTNHIHFTYGLIRLTQFTSSWDEQTGSGSIIEYANVSSIRIESASPKISNCSIRWMSASGSPIVSGNIINEWFKIFDDSAIINDNQINGEVTIDGSPTLSGNTIVTPSNLSAIIIDGGNPTIVNNTIIGGGVNGVTYFYWWELSAIYLSEGSSASIINNTISGNEIYNGNLSNAVTCNGQSIVLSNNIITGNIVIKNGHSEITDNIVYGTVSTEDSTIIFNNTITWTANGIVYSGQSHADCRIANNRLYDSDNATGASIQLNGKATVENNFITVGIYVPFSIDIIIRNNTLVKGIHGTIVPYETADGGVHGSLTSKSVIKFNNLEGGIYLTSSEDVDASYNWWGTTDTQTINHTIYDSKYDFDLGKINFTPILDEPNSQAGPNENVIIPEFPSCTILPLFVSIATVVIVCRNRLNKTKKNGVCP